MAATVLKVGLIDPPGHIDVQASERMAQRVAEMTAGEVKLEIYPAAQLGRASDMLMGLKPGTVDRCAPRRENRRRVVPGSH
ncbi:hypothetical protein BOW52_07075 [Solemya elarraichensis gill symbiont]|uniref:Uncharacterized protein n=1 Tax=Solemya elarraichensis gill symbiont TaxID=1918949 RepID=A0A1T2L3B9_9GAMM|nr:hypothetical protein BOW52_07075 [Solemya elarraichensis gill symbiont]